MTGPKYLEKSVEQAFDFILDPFRLAIPIIVCLGTQIEVEVPQVTMTWRTWFSGVEPAIP